MTVPSALGALDEGFWRALERGSFELPRCATCRDWIWPARPRCPACHGQDLDWVPVQPEGAIFSWTRTWYPFVPERSDDLPYVVVLAELAHAGNCRVLGVLEGDESELAIGARVAGRIEPAGPTTLELPSLRWRLNG